MLQNLVYLKCFFFLICTIFLTYKHIKHILTLLYNWNLQQYENYYLFWEGSYFCFQFEFLAKLLINWKLMEDIFNEKKSTKYRIRILSVGQYKTIISVNKQRTQVNYILVTDKKKLVNRKKTAIHFTTVDTISACGNSFLSKIYFVFKLLFEFMHRPLLSALLIDWLLFNDKSEICLSCAWFGVYLVKFSLIITWRCRINRMNFPTYNDSRVLFEAKIIKWS